MAPSIRCRYRRVPSFQISLYIIQFLQNPEQKVFAFHPGFIMYYLHFCKTQNGRYLRFIQDLLCIIYVSTKPRTEGICVSSRIYYVLFTFLQNPERKVFASHSRFYYVSFKSLHNPEQKVFAFHPRFY
jgi:hypothetical protein